MNERETLKRQASAYFKALGRHVHLEKRWGGGVYQREGVADFTGVAYGWMVAIEIKHPIKRPPLEPAQERYLARVRAAGGRTLVAYSLDDIQDFMWRLSSSPQCANQSRH